MDQDTNIVDVLDLRSRFLFKENIDIEGRVLRLSSYINTKVADKLCKSMEFLESLGAEPITLVINSNGGSVYDGFAIVDKIKNSPCQIITEATGMVASMATVILASGDVRKSTKNATIMYHEISASLPLERLSSMVVENAHTKDLNKRIAKFMASASKKPYLYWLKVGKHTDFYMDADKALELGVIDEVINHDQ